jgi:hypothetical protein
MIRQVFAWGRRQLTIANVMKMVNWSPAGIARIGEAVSSKAVSRL